MQLRPDTQRRLILDEADPITLRTGLNEMTEPPAGDCARLPDQPA